jgi:hypothetical protein
MMKRVLLEEEIDSRLRGNDKKEAEMTRKMKNDREEVEMTGR